MSLKRENISLASFGGSPEILEECMEVVSYIKNATDYQNAGAKVPKGILLEGPPGTGKTLLAKAIAAETDAYFISISASEFVELYVGVGAAKIRELFRRARENKPCIIFIDEIDAVGKKRGSSSLGGNDEREQTLNQLLSEMDGFTALEDVLIIAATNRKDILDPALLRPGRFDRILNVPLPDRVSRKRILEVHSRGKRVFPAVDYDELSDLTAGLSGAEIKNVLNEAAIFAARRGETVIYERDITAAVEKAAVGLIKRVETRSQAAIRRVAIHEIGHAFLCFQFPAFFDLKKVSIQSTYNGAGGYTLFSEKTDVMESGLYTKKMLKKRLLVAMGGKAAETVFYGEEGVSTGASQDLKEANRLARQMVSQYGMGDELTSFSKEENENLSEALKQMVDEKSRDLVIEAYQTAIQLIKEHRGEIEDLVERILEKKTLNVLEFLRWRG
jgi:cell division protease FtsH